VSFTNPAADAALTGTATVTMAATGGSGTGYTYKLSVDGINVYAGSTNTVGWNTTNVSSGMHTLTATVTDSTGHSGRSSRSVTVSNTATTASPSVSFTASPAGATVSGVTRVTLGSSGGSGSGYTYTLAVDGVIVSTGPKKTIAWNTLTATNGTHTLTATVRDSNGKTGTATRFVRVSNPVTGIVATLMSPKNRRMLTGSVAVRMTVSGSTASTRTFALFQDGVKMWSKTTTANSATWAWDTASWTVDGSHTLRLRVNDSAGNAATTSVKVRVTN
jgi:hypothetical protein